MLSWLDAHERRWLTIFLILGSAYIGLLLLQLAAAWVGALSQLLLVLFLAWLLAFVLSPLVDYIDDRSRLPRGMAAAIVYLFVLLALGFTLFYLASSITQQLGELVDEFPETEAEIEATLRQWEQSIGIGRFRPDLVALFNDVQANAGAIGGALFSQAQSIAGVTIAAIGALVLITIISLYMVMDRDRILNKLRRAVPRRYEDELEILERSIGRAFGGFLRAQLTLALIQAVITAGVGIVFDIPYLFLVASVSAIAMLIPFFGPPLALIPPIAAVLIFRSDALIPVAGILLVTQTIIVNWLQPRLMQGALGMHPILVLVALLLGAQFAGVWGALFGIPVVAVMNVFVNYLINLRTLQEAPQVDPDSAVEEVRRATPGASKEFLVAVAAERAEEESHPVEDPARASATELRESASELRESSTEMRAAAATTRETTEATRDAAQDVRASAGELKQSAAELKETIGEVSEKRRGKEPRPTA